MTTKEHCIHELDKLMTDLRAQGTDTQPIIYALSEICLKAASSEPKCQEEYLNNLVAIFDTAAKAVRAKKVLEKAKGFMA